MATMTRSFEIYVTQIVDRLDQATKSGASHKVKEAIVAEVVSLYSRELLTAATNAASSVGDQIADIARNWKR
jgi:hypothetical protein